MALIGVSQPMRESFTYGDFISHVQAIQQEMNDIAKYIAEQCKNTTSIPKELKSRSLTFIDPYRNPITNQYMDHEAIGTVFKNFKKEYVPKFLQKSIQLGRIKWDVISQLSEQESSQRIHEYPDGAQFVTYVEVIVSVLSHDCQLSDRIALKVPVSETINNIKIAIETMKKREISEFKSYKIDPRAPINETFWNEGQLLSLNDTILSCKLYEGNYMLMAKINYKDSSPSSQIFIKSLTGRITILKINGLMTVANIKALLQDAEGIPADQPRLIFRAAQLQDEKTVSDYMIPDESIIHLVLRLRGGMYHFTSGRQDFDPLPPPETIAVRNVLTFKFPNIHYYSQKSLAELQNAIIQGQLVLSELLREIVENPGMYSHSNIKTILLSNDNNAETGSKSDEDESSNDQ